jgi:hypothetical protein
VVALAEDGIVEETGTEESQHPDPSGKSATIRLQSKLAYSFTKPQPDRYLILRGEKGKAKNETTRDTPKIDWNGIAPVLACAPLWASPFLSGKKGKQDEELDPKRLAEITGLRFPMDREEER